MKLAFAGTPEFAATVLCGLLASEHEIGLVISQPDRPRGRGRKPHPTPVAALAMEHGLILKQPIRISEVAHDISRHDALVVAAYGQILRPDTLHAARHDAWNVHGSLLPKYRGAAPVERAVMNGETETGVSIMKMDEGLDTGPVALQQTLPIRPDTTGGLLRAAIAELGAKAVVEVMRRVEKNSVTLSMQDNEQATYAPKLEDDERSVRWAWTVERVHNVVRALTPHIGARAYHPSFSGPLKLLRTKIVSTDIPEEDPGKILAAKQRIVVCCGEGVLEILELQAPGKKPLAAPEFLRGSRFEGAFLP